MTDRELSALRLVLPRHLSAELGDGSVLVTLHARPGSDPLVTWSLTPAGETVLGGPRLTEWVEYLGGTAATALESIGGSDPDDRIDRIVHLTADSTQAFGDDFRVAVEAVHTHDPRDWF